MTVAPEFADLMRESPRKHRRYRSAGELDVARLDSKSPDFAPEGHCQWCGKKRESKRPGRFCPGKKRRSSECYLQWAYWWWSRPAYKRVVLVRDDFTCRLCGVCPMKNYAGVELPELSLLHVDHITPFSKGGTSEPANLQTLCATCNLRKGVR